MTLSARSAAAILLLLGALSYPKSVLAVFPFDMDNMESDTDAYTPNPNPNYHPIIGGLDPTLGGAPPPNDEWVDARTGGGGVIEEVPSGWSGITASSGNNFAAIYRAGTHAPHGWPSYSIDPIITSLNSAPTPDPNPLLPFNVPQNTWSHQMDLYTDPSIEPTLGVGGGYGNGSNGVADFWWTNGVNDAFFGGYTTEFGFTAEVFDNGIDPKYWKISTTPGDPGNPLLNVPVGQWISLELRIIDNRWYGGGGANDGQFGYLFYVWDQSHQNLLATFRRDSPGETFQPSLWETIGGPLYSWFAYTELNMRRIIVDDVGVTFPSYYGDMNGDGVRDNGDIQPMERALANPGTWAILYPNAAVGNMREQRGDINGDGVFDNFDIQPMEKLLTGNWTVLQGGGNGPETVAVPEPSSLVLVGIGALGLIGLARRRRLS